MPQRIPKVQRGTPITAEWANKLADAVNVLQSMSVAGGLTITWTSAGVVIAGPGKGTQQVGFANLNADMTVGSTVSCSLLDTDEDGDLVDTGDDVSMDEVGHLRSGYKVISGAQVQWVRINGWYKVVDWNCDDEEAV